MSPTSKREYILTIRLRNAQASRAAKSQILNEFCATTGYHRKAAIRVLTGPPPRPHRRRAPQPTYTERTLQLLKAIWGWICSPSSAFIRAQWHSGLRGEVSARTISVSAPRTAYQVPDSAA